MREIFRHSKYHVTRVVERRVSYSKETQTQRPFAVVERDASNRTIRAYLTAGVDLPAALRDDATAKSPAPAVWPFRPVAIDEALVALRKADARVTLGDRGLSVRFANQKLTGLLPYLDRDGVCVDRDDLDRLLHDAA